MEGSHAPRLRAPIVKVRNFLTMESVLKDLGADPVEALRDAGLPFDLFARPDASVRLEEIDRLVMCCERLTGCDDFGFRVGERNGAATIGIAGLVSINCETVREAWQTVAIGLKTTDTLGSVVFTESDDEAQIGYELFVRGIESQHHIVDCAMATIVNVMRDLRGPGWRPQWAKMARPAPSDPGAIRRFFGCPVFFEAPAAAVTFPADELDAPVRNRSSVHKDVLAPLLDLALSQADNSFLFEARSTVRALVANGANPSFDRFCQMMNIGRDKLKRRFRADGISFSEIVDEARVEFSQALLRSGKPVGEVALAVGYSEMSSFTRAFTRRVGASPSRWRKSSGAG